MDDIYIDEYNRGKEHKVLIVCDDMIADMIINKKLDPCWYDKYTKLNPVVTKIFIRGKKLNISLFLFDNCTLKYQKMLD